MIVFFFQAEDGIRDLVRSRGLGDVYKRQHVHRVRHNANTSQKGAIGERAHGNVIAIDIAGVAVSYTHLTLPTSDLV